MAGGRLGTTLYVVAYDMSDDRRRTKVHKILSGFGEWTQYSVFECYLTPKEWILLQSRLEEHVKPAEDSVRFYPLCSRCAGRVKTVGSEPPQERKVYIV